MSAYLMHQFDQDWVWMLNGNYTEQEARGNWSHMHRFIRAATEADKAHPKCLSTSYLTGKRKDGKMSLAEATGGFTPGAKKLLLCETRT